MPFQKTLEGNKEGDQANSRCKYPLDVALEKACDLPEVRLHLTPLPGSDNAASSSSRSNANRGNKREAQMPEMDSKEVKQISR